MFFEVGGDVLHQLGVEVVSSEVVVAVIGFIDFNPAGEGR